MAEKMELNTKALNNPDFRKEYRRRLADCLRGAWSYRGTEQDYKQLIEKLSDMERWLNSMFGSEAGKRFPAELEESVAQAWRPEHPDRASVGHSLHIAARQFAKRISRILDHPEIDQSSILTVETDGLILPPVEKEIPKGDGTREFKETRFEERTKTLVNALHSAGIHPEDLILVRGKTNDNMMRKTSYTIIEIPRLNREILVCDQVGEGTFVIYGILDRKILLATGKEGLQEKFRSLVVKFTCFDIEEWKNQVTEALLKDVNVDELLKVDVRTQEGLRKEIFRQVPMAGQWAGMKSKDKRSFFCIGLKMRAVFSKFGLKGNAFSMSNHLQLGRKIYGENHECLREITLEMIKGEILRQIPTATQWSSMSHRERAKLKIFGVGLHAIGNLMGLNTKALCSRADHLKLGRLIYLDNTGSLDPEKSTEELGAIIKNLVPNAEDWVQMGYAKRSEFKADNKGLVALATCFGVEGDP